MGKSVFLLGWRVTARGCRVHAVARGWRCRYGEAQGMETKGAAFMVLKKESSRARREGSAGRGKRGPVGRAAEKGPGQSRGVAMVDVDPWGAFFEKFWEQPAE